MRGQGRDDHPALDSPGRDAADRRRRFAGQGRALAGVERWKREHRRAAKSVCPSTMCWSFHAREIVHVDARARQPSSRPPRIGGSQEKPDPMTIQHRNGVTARRRNVASAADRCQFLGGRLRASVGAIPRILSVRHLRRSAVLTESSRLAGGIRQHLGHEFARNGSHDSPCPGSSDFDLPRHAVGSIFD